MTTNSPRLTDDLLKRALADLASGPDGDELLADVLRSVDSQPQVRPRMWDARGWGRAALLVAVAVLVAATFGATVVLTRPEPSPQPSARPTGTPLPLTKELIEVQAFVVPFTYRLPVGTSSRLQNVAPGPEPVYVANSRASRFSRLELFPVTGYVHDCGTRNGSGLATSPIIREPRAFLTALRETFDVGIGPIRTTTLGGLPAFAADIDPTKGSCDHASLHTDGMGLGFSENEPKLSEPGRLIVGRANGRTIAAIISSPYKDDLAAWLPIAQAYLDGLVFETGQ